MDQQAFNPDDRIEVSLKAQEWNTVMAALSDAPYRVAAPLIEAIRSQCMMSRERSSAPV